MHEHPILSVKGLRIEAQVEGFSATLVRDVSFDVFENECLCIVGESGSGKTLTALSIINLYPSKNIVRTAGSIVFKGVKIDNLSNDLLRHLRGKQVGFVFQEPMTALNPVISIGEQIQETIEEHLQLSKKISKEKTLEVMRMVGLPDVERLYYAFPHELSGGLRQRAMIAIALSCEPHLLIADEPTTALDVTTQLQIINLLKSLQKNKKMTSILITHNLGIVKEIGDRIIIMYLGEVVEEGTVDEIFLEPLHPYSKGLLASIPSHPSNLGRNRLTMIRGTPPRYNDDIAGCVFSSRCDNAMDVCIKTKPNKKAFNNRMIKCHLFTDY